MEMGTNSWRDYVLGLTYGESQNDVSKRAGISQPTVGRWLRGDTAKIDPGNVARFALAYDRSVLEAFVAARLLPFDEAKRGLDARAVRMLERLGVVPSDYSTDQTGHSA